MQHKLSLYSTDYCTIPTWNRSLFQQNKLSEQCKDSLNCKDSLYCKLSRHYKLCPHIVFFKIIIFESCHVQHPHKHPSSMAFYHFPQSSTPAKSKCSTQWQLLWAPRQQTQHNNTVMCTFGNNINNLPLFVLLVCVILQWSHKHNINGTNNCRGPPFQVAKEVQNRTGQKIMPTLTEGRSFHEFFDRGVATVMWLENAGGETEENAEISHMLWAKFSSSATHWLSKGAWQPVLQTVPLTPRNGANTCGQWYVPSQTLRVLWWAHHLFIIAVKHAPESSFFLDYSQGQESQEGSPNSLECWLYWLQDPAEGTKFCIIQIQRKIGIELQGGCWYHERRIKWLNGPFPCKHWADNSCFHDCHINYLDPSERLEADDGCAGESPFVCCITSEVLNHLLEKATAQQKRVQGRNEMMNAWIKSFHILDSVYRHDQS